MRLSLPNAVKRFAHDNAANALTGVGIIGTVTTAVLSGRATLQAYHALNAEKIARADMGTANPPMSRKDEILVAGPYFVPPVGVGLVTVASILGANRVSATQAAALTAAYAYSERNFEDYKSKIEEKLGVRKSEELRTEIQQDRVRRDEDKSVIILGHGEVMCYDSYSDRYFMTTVERIKKAERVVQNEILDANQCALSVFYHELDVPQTQFSEHVGFNLNHGCNVIVDTVLRNDEPALAIEFADLPIWEFESRY